MFRVLDKTLGTVAAVALIAGATVSGNASAASAPVVLAQASTSSTPSAGVPNTANPGTPAGASTQTATPETGVQPKSSQTTSAAAPKAAAKADKGPHREEHVEARITELHGKLKITPQQESAWNDFANAMRDDARQMDALFAESHQSGPLTALQQMQNYQKFTDTHADGVRKLVPAFETLYNSFSDDQKKNADRVFAEDRAKREQHMERKHKKG